MDISLSASPASDVAADWLIIPHRPGQPPVAATEVAQRLGERGDLKEKRAELTLLPDCGEVTAERVCFVAMGESSDDPRDLIKPLATAFQKVLGQKTRTIACALPPDVEPAVAVEQIVRTATVAGVGQAFYQESNTRSLPDQLLIVGAGDDSYEAAITRGQVLGESANVTRELVNRHAGDINPVTFAAKAKELANDAGLACEVFDDQWLRDEKFGSMLAVAQGSATPARLVVLRHNGGGDDGELFGLCGKGVTFDSGGLSLKPSDGMKAMKADMGGGATVLGTMLAISRLNLPVNVIGVIGLVENMISGGCYRLGDVLTARNGVTIEVHNTDAEGRLVLADVLSWTVDQGASRIVDLATLTGACVVALGEEITGLMPNDDEWASELLDAADSEGEDVWQLPMHDAFSEQLKSDVADCKNVGTRWGGAITAAKFLEKFVGDSTWAHLDIAGPAFANSSKPDRDGGGTGVMVRTLVRLFERRGGA